MIVGCFKPTSDIFARFLCRNLSYREDRSRISPDFLRRKGPREIGTSPWALVGFENGAKLVVSAGMGFEKVRQH